MWYVSFPSLINPLKITKKEFLVYNTHSCTHVTSSLPYLLRQLCHEFLKGLRFTGVHCKCLELQQNQGYHEQFLDNDRLLDIPSQENKNITISQKIYNFKRNCWTDKILKKMDKRVESIKFRFPSQNERTLLNKFQSLFPYRIMTSPSKHSSKLYCLTQGIMVVWRGENNANSLKIALIAV